MSAKNINLEKMVKELLEKLKLKDDDKSETQSFNINEIPLEVV